MTAFSVSGFAGEHLSLPGHDHAEGPQDDCGGSAGGSDPTRGSHQPAQLHHGGKSDLPDVRKARKVTGLFVRITVRRVRLRRKLKQNHPALLREERNQTQVLRQQQDEAYLISLRADQEKERKKKEEQEQRRQEEEAARQKCLAEERRQRVSNKTCMRIRELTGLSNETSSVTDIDLKRPLFF